jgi:hypothetical protein
MRGQLRSEASPQEPAVRNTVRIGINYDVVFDRAIFLLDDDCFSRRLDVFELLADCHVAFDAARLGHLQQVVVENAGTMNSETTNAVRELVGDSALDELRQTIETSRLDGPGLVNTSHSLSQADVDQMSSTSWQAVHRQVRSALGRVELTALPQQNTDSKVSNWASALRPSSLLAALALPVREAMDRRAGFTAPTPQWLAGDRDETTEEVTTGFCLLAETAESLGIEALVVLYQVDDNLEVHIKALRPDAEVAVRIGEAVAVGEKAAQNLLIARFEGVSLTDQIRPVLMRTNE